MVSGILHGSSHHGIYQDPEYRVHYVHVSGDVDVLWILDGRHVHDSSNNIHCDSGIGHNDSDMEGIQPKQLRRYYKWTKEFGMWQISIK